MIEFLLTYSNLIAIVAVVYTVLNTEPGEIFSRLYKWIENKLMARKMYLQRTGIRDDGQKVVVDKYIFQKGEVIYFPYKKTLHDYEWLFKPIIGCERCVGGQMALWFYVLLSWLTDVEYDLLVHIFLVSMTIYSTVIFKTIYLWQKRIQEKM